MITLTESAIEKAKLLTDLDATALKIEVVRGPHGCVHGWNFIVGEEDIDGETVYESDDVRIVVDSETVPLIEDASIDFREDATAIGFTIDAPQLARGNRDGCGHH